MFEKFTFLWIKQCVSYNWIVLYSYVATPNAPTGHIHPHKRPRKIKAKAPLQRHRPRHPHAFARLANNHLHKILALPCEVGLRAKTRPFGLPPPRGGPLSFAALGHRAGPQVHPPSLRNDRELLTQEEAVIAELKKMREEWEQQKDPLVRYEQGERQALRERLGAKVKEL